MVDHGAERLTDTEWPLGSLLPAGSSDRQGAPERQKKHFLLVQEKKSLHLIALFLSLLPAAELTSVALRGIGPSERECRNAAVASAPA